MPKIGAILATEENSILTTVISNTGLTKAVKFWHGSNLQPKQSDS